MYVAGEIISQKKISISKHIKLPELTERLSDIGADMLVDCLRTLPTSLKNAKPQSDEGVTYGKFELNIIIIIILIASATRHYYLN